MAGKAVIEALQLKKKGYNCAQAVAVPFCAHFGVDKTLAFKALEGFGSGMGVQGVCGAISGAVFAAGLKYSDGNLDTPASRLTTYKVSADIVQKFEREIGSTCCKEILQAGGQDKIATCDRCVMVAATLAEKTINLK